MAVDERDLVKLTDAGHPLEAGALREFLIDNGVYTFVQGEHHSSMLGVFGPTAIGLNLLVMRRDLLHARELVTAYFQAEPVESLDDMLWDDDDPQHAQLPVARVVKRL